MSKAILSYSDVIERYRRLLEANPGKGLLICWGGNVALLQDGEVIGAPLRRDGKPEMESSYEFEAEAFNEELGCWLDDTPAQTLSRIENPTFVDLASGAQSA